MTSLRPFSGRPAEPLTPAWAGKFDTFTQWVNKASGWIDGQAVCVDSIGRRCLVGRDFMRARDEGTFPVWFFWECERAARDERTDG